MSQQLCIKLKPLFIEFYAQNDCPLQSRFSAVIQLNNTIYKTGIIKAQKNKHLQLLSLSWIQFIIDKSQYNSYISIQLITHNEDSESISQNQDRNNQNLLKYKRYKSMLPIEQLMRIPVNRKKKFNFPLLYQGEIKAEGQFKIVIKQQRKDLQDTIFKQINLKQNQRISNNKKLTKQDLKKSPSRKQQKKKILKPKLSDTFVVITPDLFIKKAQVPNLQHNCPNNQSTNADMSMDVNMNTDLISKFQMLNRKFSQQAPSANNLNQNRSIWEDQQQNQNSSYDKSNNNFNNRELFHYDVIDQEKQQEQQAEY